MAGPALIAFGIDHALPALRAGDSLPLMLAGAAYLAAAVAAAGLTALYVTPRRGSARRCCWTSASGSSGTPSG